MATLRVVDVAVCKSGRPRKRHVWRETVVDAWQCATEAWWLEAEAVTFLYATELAEYKALHPMPQLKWFMVHLSYGWSADRERAA